MAISIRFGLIMFTLTLLFLLFATQSFALAPPEGFREITPYGDINPKIHVCFSDVEVFYNQDFWHYGDYWVDGANKISIPDSERMFWDYPEDYHDEPGMQILASAELPTAVKAFINVPGNKDLLCVSLIQKKRGYLRDNETSYYKIADGKIFLYTFPRFRVERDIHYEDFVSGLTKSIPVVREGFGYNIYSMVGKDGVGQGSCRSSLTPNDNYIEFTDITDAAGHIKPGKSLTITKVNGSITEEIKMPSDELTIGSGSFAAGYSVGMMFEYCFGLYFYTYPDTPAAPDLTIESVLGTSYYADSVVSSFVTVKNNSETPLSGIPVEFFDGTQTQRQDIDLLPGEEKKVPFDWLTPILPTSLSILAHVNSEAIITERNYSNNRMEVVVLVYQPPTDLSVTGIVPDKYPAGLDVITVVTIMNSGSRVFFEDEKVDVRIMVPAISYEETVSVDIGSGKSTTIRLAFSAPESPSPPLPLAFVIIAEINPTRRIGETDYKNNRLSVTALAETFTTPSPYCDKPRVEWKEEVISHYKHIRTTLRGGIKIIRRVPVYKTNHYYAEASLSSVLSDEIIKSGYGFECEVTTGMSTNYHDSGKIKGIQAVYAFLPMDGYVGSIKLEAIPGEMNKWRFPKNPDSKTDSRVIYIPVDWPDDKPFIINFTGYHAQSPGGAMCVSAAAALSVSGSMFEDDYTAMY